MNLEQFEKWLELEYLTYVEQDLATPEHVAYMYMMVSELKAARKCVTVLRGVDNYLPHVDRVGVRRVLLDYDEVIENGSK